MLQPDLKACLSKNLRAARSTAGLTQEALAREAGCTQEAIVMYEKAHRLPRLEIAVALGEALNVTVDELCRP